MSEFKPILMVKRLLVTERVGGMVPTLKVVSSDFAIEDGHIGGGKKLLKALKLLLNWRRVILSEDSCQTQKDYQDQWVGISQQTITKRLKEMMIQNDREGRILGTPRIILRIETKRCRATPHVAKLVVKKYLEMLKWQILPYTPYSPDVAPSIDFAQRHTAWLTSTSAHMKKRKIGSTHGSYRKMNNFSPWDSPAAREMRCIVTGDGKYFET
nr:Mariner Mos1 transposase [Hymenolepis microstoma]